jgi:hypothetical protein
MAKFYFHISSNEVYMPDQVGVEMSDLNAAYRHALKIIHNSMLYITDELIWQGWLVKIADEDGQSLLNVLYPQSYIDQPSVDLKIPGRGPDMSVGLYSGQTRPPYNGCPVSGCPARMRKHQGMIN